MTSGPVRRILVFFPDLVISDAYTLPNPSLGRAVGKGWAVSPPIRQGSPVLFVSPGIAASAGHDKVTGLARAALGSESQLTLAPPEGGGLAAIGWRGLEWGKLTLAQLSAGHPAIRWLEGSSTTARESRLVARMLTADYRRALASEGRAVPGSCIVSSHYLALSERPSGMPAVLLGPDVHAQPAAGAIHGPRLVLSPGPSYSEGLRKVGFRADEISELGPPVPDRLHEVRAARLARRRAGAPGAVLFAIGGSAPESSAAVHAAREVHQAGHRAVVLVGDGRPHAQRLRHVLEPVAEVWGGRAGQTRADELAAFFALLAREELTTWVSRPNEGAMLALALGFELWLLPPYQPHERAARSTLRGWGVQDAMSWDGAARAPGATRLESWPLRVSRRDEVLPLLETL